MNYACSDLCGGCAATCIPTANVAVKLFHCGTIQIQKSDAPKSSYLAIYRGLATRYSLNFSLISCSTISVSVTRRPLATLW